MGLEEELKAIIKRLQEEKRSLFNRRVSVGDLLTERHDNARFYGWGEGTTCYDNVLVLGDVKIGKHCWIGPNAILDGSGGGLEIGDYVGVGAGVQIYTHDAVNYFTSGGKLPQGKAPTKIGSSVAIGPGAIITQGVTIGDHVSIGPLSLVNRDIPAGSQVIATRTRLMRWPLDSSASAP
jgi:acetyltransferase-like isoleucine patch superfamily enzyme